MSLEPDQLDLAELTASLVGEVRAGVLAAEGYAEGGVQVVAATVRVGQRPLEDGPPPEPLATSPARGPGAVVERPHRSPVVLQERGEEVGWEIELSLGRGEPVVEVGPGRGIDVGGLPTAVSLWRDRAPSVLKGIDVERTRRLAGEGIRTVGDLLALDEVAIAGVVSRLRSHRYLDYWVRTALLRTPAPRLAASPADTRRLSTLAGRHPAQLRRLIGPEVCSTSAATALFDLLAHWGAALNRTALAGVTLGDLRAAVRVERS